MRLLAVMTWAAALTAQPYDHYLTGSAADVRPRTSAGLLLSGGGGDVEDAFRWLMRKSGGGDIVILRASGSDGYNKFIPTLGTVDSVETFVTKTPEASHDSKLLMTLRNAEAIFLAGGDQWNYIRMWKGTPVEDAIHEAYRRGCPIGGSSAGLAVLGEHSFSAQKDTVTSAQALANPMDERVTIESEFLQFPPLKGIITDSHFSRRDRMGRLLVFLSRLKGARGIGIDEATTLLVEPDGSSTAVGKGAVYFVRPTGAATYSVYKLAAGAGRFNTLSWKGEGGSAYDLKIEGSEVIGSKY